MRRASSSKGLEPRMPDAWTAAASRNLAWRNARRVARKGPPFLLGPVDSGSSSSAVLVERHRDKTDLALRIGDQKQRRLAAFLLEGVDALGDVGGRRHGFLPDLHDHVAGLDALVGGGRVRIDAGDEHALHRVLDVVALARLLGQAAEAQTQGLLGHARRLNLRL